MALVIAYSTFDKPKKPTFQLWSRLSEKANPSLRLGFDLGVEIKNSCLVT